MKKEDVVVGAFGKYKVQNMESARGNLVANQFIISTPEGTIFQSYQSIIAMKSGSTIVLDKNKWDYSRTTMKYLNWFLGGQSAKETRAKIESGEYRLVDLN